MPLKRILLVTTIITISLFRIAAYGGYSESPNAPGFEIKPGIGADGLESGFLYYTFTFSEVLDFKIGVSDTLSSLNDLKYHDMAVNFDMEWKAARAEEDPFYTSLLFSYGLAESTGSDLDDNDIAQYGDGFSTGMRAGFSRPMGRLWFYGGGRALLSSWKYILSAYDSAGDLLATTSSERNIYAGPELGMGFRSEKFVFDFNTVVLFDKDTVWTIYPTLRISL